MAEAGAGVVAADALTVEEVCADMAPLRCWAWHAGQPGACTHSAASSSQHGPERQQHQITCCVALGMSCAFPASQPMCMHDCSAVTWCLCRPRRQGRQGWQGRQAQDVHLRWWRHRQQEDLRLSPRPDQGQSVEHQWCHWQAANTPSSPCCPHTLGGCCTIAVLLH